eukprot:scaffold5182_cov264-Pinguiococcus_pyrenoidosus.AAC.1
MCDAWANLQSLHDADHFFSPGGVSLKGGWPLYAVSTTTEGKKLTSKTKDALVQQATLLGIEVANHTKEILAFKILVQTGSLDWDRDSATRSAKEVQ